MKIFSALIFAISISFLVSSMATAQQAGPQFMITWRAQTYVPPGYQGKVLPLPNSPITASFELIDGGRIVDVSGYTVQWYIDGEFVSGGPGLQKIKFRIPPFPGNTVDLRVQLPNYRNNFIVKTVEIPMGKPQAVIDAPFPGGQFRNAPIQVRALPYFFSAESAAALNFFWDVNGESPANSENPDALNINLNPETALGSSVNIGLTIKNPANELESAKGAAALIFREQ